MATPAVSRRAARELRNRARRRRRRIAIVLSVVGILILGVVGWIGIRGLIAKSDLETARAMISQLKTDIADLDIAAARETFQEIKSRTDEAEVLTTDPVWRTAELTPWLGGNLRVVREVAELTSTVMNDVASPLVDIAEKIDPANFAPKDGAVNIEPFIAAGPALVEANARVGEVLAAAQKVDTSEVIGPVAEAKEKFVSLLGGIAPQVDMLATLVPLLPTTLGSESPRTYVVMFQNPAESRALGGGALSFALVKIDNGHIDLEASIPASTGAFHLHPESVIPIPDGAEQVYPDGTFGTFIANATLRPSFTTAAQITSTMWAEAFGTHVDGVLSIDPVALGYILRATDPITLPSGDVISNTTLVPLLLNEVYQRFNTHDTTADNEAQDKLFGQAVDATFDRLTNGPLDAKILMASLLQGWDEHRILYWSAHEDEEAVLAKIGLNGELPVSDDDDVRVGVYFQDNVGAKLNYYLKTAVRLGQASCVAGTQNYRVSVDLGSGIAPDQVSSLSRAILGVWKREGLQPGVQRMFVYLYAPPGSTITGATVNGKAIALDPLHDTDYPVGRIRVLVNPGQTITLTYDITMPGTAERKLKAEVTPLVKPTVITSEPLDCSTVAPAK